MHVTKETLGATKFKLTIIADGQQLDAVKQRVLTQLGKNLKLQGFRAGKAPAILVERSLDQNQLQTEFLEQAVNLIYSAAVSDQKMLPAAQPEISITKFVPFATLEISADVEAVGKISLADYTKIKVKRPAVSVTDGQIDDTITNLQTRAAQKTEVQRAAKEGDEVAIDFVGTDAKTKAPVAGADGKDYGLVLGSGNFIPGFEDQLVGLKAGAKKDFMVTFPKDYGVADLQAKKVNFAVTVHKVQQLTQPKLDAAFAAQVGPFKSVDELRADIRRELETQAHQEADRQYDNALVQAVADKSTAEIPDQLVDDELDRIEEQERQNVVYRGQTWQEHLDSEGVSDDEHRAKNRPAAANRVKAGLLLGEIAEKEQLVVTPEELEVQLQLLKGRYASDAKMLAELDNPANRRDIMSRLLTQKTLDTLKSFQS